MSTKTFTLVSLEWMNCVGKDFALIEIRLTTSALAQWPDYISP